MLTTPMSFSTPRRTRRTVSTTDCSPSPYPSRRTAQRSSSETAMQTHPYSHPLPAPYHPTAQDLSYFNQQPYHNYSTLPLPGDGDSTSAGAHFPLPSTSYLSPPNTTPTAASAPATVANDPRFSALFQTALGSPFLTTSDLPPRPSSPAPTADYSLIEPDPEYGAIFPNVFLPGTYYPYAVTPSAMRRQGAGASMSMPALGSSGRITGSGRRGHTVPPPTPGQWLAGTGSWQQHQHQQHHNPLRAILPKLWDVLSFPGRSMLTTLANHVSLSPSSSPTTSSSNSSSSSSSGFVSSSWSTPTTPVNYIDYADLPPLDGEEGELIDDEACCVPEPYEDAYSVYPDGSGREYGYGGHYGYREVRVATGIDIVTLLPSELGLYILTLLCLPPFATTQPGLEPLQTILTCQFVSKSWRSLADDNAIWQTLFTARWAVDLRKAQARSRARASIIDTDSNAEVEKSLPLLPEGRMSIISAIATPDRAPLQLSWKRMYMDRVELERRWVGTARVRKRLRRSLSSSTTSTATAVDIPTEVTVNPGARGDSTGVVNEVDAAGWEKWEPKVMWIKGHSDSVYCLEFDSSRIITGSRDQSIRVWSLRTGALLGSFWGAHQGSVLCLKFEKDWERDGMKKGFMVSGSSDCNICVWDLELGDQVAPGSDNERVVKGNVSTVLKGHTGGVLDLRIDENWIVSCAKDTTIHVYDRHTLTRHRILRGHEGPVNAVGLQGNSIVSASGDGKMILWDIASGERKRTFEGHDRGLACIEFRDGLIVSGSNDCRIKVWNEHTGECISTLVGHRALVRALALGATGLGGGGLGQGQGRLVSGSYDKTVKVWDLGSGRMVREFKGTHTGHIFDVKFDISRIVSTSHDHNIVVLDFSAGLDTSLFA